jgi:hypothetical protein
MYTTLELQELPAGKWADCLRDLHRQRAEWKVTVEEREPAIGADDIATWIVVDSARLRGLTLSAFPSPAVEVAWRGRDGRERTHWIEAPVRLRRALDPYARDVDLRIDRHDGGSTLLHFHR